MSFRSRVWPLVVLVAALITAAVWGVVWYRGRPIPTAALIRRLPSRDTMILSVDFDALRRAGILDMLAGTKAEEDPDYQHFVQKTGFDYSQDLDLALVAFAPDANYMLVRGRFNWGSLHDYARAEGGACINAFCRMTGSTPDRRISFFRIQKGLMGLAVSRDDSAAAFLQGPAPAGPDPEAPSEPVWLSIPTSLLRTGNLPEGTRMFARSLDKADRVILSFSGGTSQYAAHLDVRCRDERDATEIAAQLAAATARLREMIQQEHQTPNPADLSGVLTSGSFRTEGSKVIGHWTIEPSFVNNVLSGRGSR